MWARGITLFFMGELTIARKRFEQSLALYRPGMHDSQIAQYRTDWGVAGTEQELPYWTVLSGLMRVWALALQGEGTAGINEKAQNLAAVRILGQKMSGTLLLSMLVEA